MANSSLSSLQIDDRTATLVKRLARTYLRPHLGRLVAAIVCMVIAASTTAAFTQLMKPIIQEIFVNKNAAMLWPIALMTLVVFLARGLASYGQAVLMSHIGLAIMARIQGEMFHRLMHTELGFFNANSPGHLVSRFVNDVQTMRNSVAETLTGLGKHALTLVALVGVMFYEDWLLATIAFIAFPTAVLPIASVGKKMRKVSGRTQENLGDLTTTLDEAFQGMRSVKAYGMEQRETERAEASIGRVFKLMLKAARTQNILTPVMEVLGGLAIVAVLIYGGNQVISGEKQAGAFFAFITALLLAYEPLKRLAKLNNQLQRGLAAAQRVFALIDREPQLQNKPGARPLKLTAGEVALDDVSFRYDDTDEKALHHVSLTAPAGKTCALVGASGAGKSTVFNLIPRFYDVEEGAVRIDGQDVRDLTVESLRSQLAVVSQEVMLFDATVRENIAYGRPEASEREVLQAAEASGAADFIDTLPQGYDTRVGPRGARLSGGQRQRIAIARAMLKDAPILLLDEATSALDTESERKVQTALRTLMRGRTAIVIAHRLSTVRDAEIIHVLDKGQVIERGNHDELLERGGAYARLYAMQFASEGDAVQDGTTTETNDGSEVARTAADKTASA
ncbi:ABC transporter ATP-binding protein [Rhodovibrio salinarum]|uniref:ABC transporter ATP-binding protein n=1 Tax=Rhodovibrio salinarum TaxID=1087 RepID=UPI0004B5BCFA|nr:ABC transporter ATP-binding protein [Rhodovibrio salinarum]